MGAVRMLVEGEATKPAKDWHPPLECGQQVLGEAPGRPPLDDRALDRGCSLPGAGQGGTTIERGL
jgi:hypothetical protein